jgi:hypothetical protein
MCINPSNSLMTVSIERGVQNLGSLRYSVFYLTVCGQMSQAVLSSFDSRGDFTGTSIAKSGGIVFKS